MAMSDCIECWSTPCTCGHEYETWSNEGLVKQIRMLERVLEDKKPTEPKIEINGEYLKSISDEELFDLAKELEGELSSHITYQPLRRNIDLLEAVQKEYLEREQIKYIENEEKEKNKQIILKFTEHVNQSIGIKIPKMYVESFENK